jgi:hypothetical protein
MNTVLMTEVHLGGRNSQEISSDSFSVCKSYVYVSSRNTLIVIDLVLKE